MKLSIVTTLYNSSSFVREFHRRASAAAAAVTQDYELIFVNDGSADDSLDIALSLHASDAHVRVVDLSRNFGHHKAIMTAISEIANRRGLLVIEDAAQGLGSTYQSRPLGHLGDLAALSFHETKNVIAGEGGALLVNDARWAQRAEILWEKGTNRTQFFRGMQPYLFPYVGYFQLMHAVDRFVIADDFTFIKQGWINRNRLLINGNAAYFTVPLKRHPATALIHEVEIDDAGNSRWRGPLLKTIANFYRRAPSFEAVYPIAERVFGGPFTHIADMARASVREVALYLGLTTTVVDSSAVYGNAHLKGQDRVIDMILILVIGGVLMLMLGIIGEYVWRIYDEVKGKPNYVVRQIH